MSKKVHVIHHTHWDFEWYFTDNESFVQLVYHLDEVMNALENNVISYYLLDGQMSILDDYLDSFPEKKARLTKLVQSGKLIIGPWYTQTDEMIVAGESIVRNLNLGIKKAEELGNYMDIGYLPDSFGQSKDMPKIYNGFGMNQVVFWRGVPEDVTEEREFNWSSEDGSNVTVSNIKDGYYVGVGLIHNDNAEETMDLIEKGATSKQLTLPVGGDQRYVDYNLRERIDLYNNQLDNHKLVESTYSHFFDSIQTDKLNEYSGEFLSASVSKIHRSIYSSRYDHKQWNDKLERRMIYQLEPLMVMAEELGIPYKRGLIDRIWKLLNKNHAHDSAGGCNSDKTNEIISNRYVEADQLSYSAIDYLTRKLSESKKSMNEKDLVVFNTLPWEVKKTIKIEVSSNDAEVALYHKGKKLPQQQLNKYKESNDSIKRTKAEMDPDKFYYIHELAVEVTIPPMTYEVLTVEKKENNLVETKLGSIENSRYKINFEKGQLNLRDKELEKDYLDFMKLENSGDEGDTYDYSPPYQDDHYLLDFANAEVTVQTGPVLETMVIKGEWEVAADLEDRADKKRTATIPYELTIELEKDSQLIKNTLVVDNQAKDHRLRVLVDTNHSNEYSYTDTPFGTIKRAVEDRHLHTWKELGWKEEPTAIYPMIHYINAHNEESSMTIFSKGMKEYQLIGNQYEKIAVTLFRSVGYLGRPDLIRRPGKASGNEFKYIQTPDSQLLKELSFEFAIQLDKEYQPAKLMKNHTDYAVDLAYYQIQDLNLFTAPIKYFVSNPLIEEVEKPLGIELDADKLVYSSLRKSIEDDGMEIRLYNPDLSKTIKDGKIILPKEHSYEFVNLKGDPLTRRYN
ncbi:MAG: alpha-mannosidase, partial [Atopostipes suicloacalis]|nr:alpha-mannosidase [Atopostipes suicloacalis]